jgi:hypothetical protein
MDLQQIRLGLVLKEAGVPVDVRTFDGRLTLQKSGYLLQRAGVPLGYHFNWYLRGPYSPDLTDDVFTLAAAERSEPAELDQWKLDPQSQEIVAGVKDLFTDAFRRGLQAPRWLELLASTLFLVRTRQASANDPSGINKVLLRNDKHYSEAEVCAGVQELREYGFAV